MGKEEDEPRIRRAPQAPQSPRDTAALAHAGPTEPIPATTGPAARKVGPPRPVPRGLCGLLLALTTWPWATVVRDPQQKVSIGHSQGPA